VILKIVEEAANGFGLFFLHPVRIATPSPKQPKILKTIGAHTENPDLL
jgi:hypothetical protein